MLFHTVHITNITKNIKWEEQHDINTCRHTGALWEYFISQTQKDLKNSTFKLLLKHAKLYFMLILHFSLKSFTKKLKDFTNTLVYYVSFQYPSFHFPISCTAEVWRFLCMYRAFIKFAFIFIWNRLRNLWMKIHCHGPQIEMTDLVNRLQ